MILGGEMTRHQAKPHDRQHDGTHTNVEAMKTRQHVEGRAINTRRKLEVQLRIRMGVLVGLETDKHRTQNDRRREPQLDQTTIALFERMVSNCQGHTRGQQQGCVDRGDRPGPHRLKGFNGARWPAVRPVARKVGPQNRPVIQVTEPRQRNRTCIEERTKKPCEKHHLRKNEPAHRPSEGDVYVLAVLAGL